LFEGHDDVGTVQHQGSVKYDAAKRTYTISGSGENMWAATDAFHFVWKKVSGDVSLAADLSILGTGGNAHRKGVLMIRQSLDPDSAYVSVALHGVGLTALQSREAKGAQTYEVISNVSAPARLQILKRGHDFYMWLNRRMAGGSFRIPLTAPFYVGLGVCAHGKEAVETVVFSNVELTTGALKPARKPALYSTLETVPLAARTDRQAVLQPVNASRRQTGRATACFFCSIAVAESSACRRQAARRNLSIPGPRRKTTATTESPPMGPCSQSATDRHLARPSSSCRSRVEHHGVSPSAPLLTGTAGPPMGRRSSSAASAAAGLTSTPFPRPGAPRPA
jgi:hypothetical protein